MSPYRRTPRATMISTTWPSLTSTKLSTRRAINHGLSWTPQTNIDLVRSNDRFDNGGISLLVLCFNAMYQWKLFEHGYAMNDDNLKNFHVVEKIDSSEIGWTLGYMINQTNGLDAQSRPERSISKSEFGGLLFLCILCLIVFTIVAVTAFRSYRGRRGFSET